MILITNEIALYLDAAGVGVFDPDGADGSIYVEKLPQTPHAAIAIFSTGGYQADGRHGYDRPTFQVRARGERHDVAGARALAESAYAALQGLHSVALPGGTWLVNCRGIQSGPVNIGNDGNDCPEFVINFEAEVRNLTQHRE